jgi:nitrogen fixation/metabolism regulation signal transduction histidine kinase
VSLRRRFTLYVVLVHVVFAAVVVLLLRDRQVWLLAVEAVAVLSLLAGLRLIHSLFAPLDLVRTGADYLRDRDFTTRLREVGHPELDPLIRVYNHLAEHLREERVHGEEREHFLQKITAATPTGVLVLDVEGRVVMANPAGEGLLGVTTGALLGHRLAEVSSPLVAELDDIAIGETRLVRVQGRRRVLCRALSFMDRGFARRFLLLEELTEELHRSEKAAYGKLVRLMSHEVNNTAGAVQSLLESCLNYAGQLADADREDFSRALGVAIARTASLDHFMREFAEVVRLPAPRLAPCDVPALLERIEVLLHADCTARRISWTWERREAIPPQLLDAAQMEQALINICRNAIEAIGIDGTLTVGLGAANGRAALWIGDTGGGIPPEVEPHLFTPFFTSKANGQGIGLTLVQEILLAQSCGFTLENVPGGARFTILLPGPHGRRSVV